MKNKKNEDINFDDIPELTKEDFVKAIKNPFAGKFKDGYTIVVEHNDYDEIITVSKKRQKKPANAADFQYVAESTRSYGEQE